MKKTLILISVILVCVIFLVSCTHQEDSSSNDNVPNKNVPEYTSTYTLAEIRAGGIPEQMYWQYGLVDDQYVDTWIGLEKDQYVYTWIGPKDQAISLQNDIVLDDVRRGVPVIFPTSVDSKFDLSTGRLYNHDTGERYQYFIGDETDRILKPGTYIYVATKIQKTYEPFGGFTAWPLLNGD